MLTYGSLFSGIGGLDKGLDDAGLVCRWQVEKSDYARRVLTKHWPDVPKWDDVRTWPQPGCERVDCIVGGDPCQANSAAVGAGVSGHTSLGGEFVRIVDELRPRIVLRENPAHTRKDAPWPWWRMRSALESIGYAVLPFRLRACCFGAFHQRERVFLLAELANTDSKRLARRETKAQSGIASEPPRRVHAEDWLAVSASRGFGSRAGLPHYVDRVIGIGNAVYPAVAEWIGRKLIEAIQ